MDTELGLCSECLQTIKPTKQDGGDALYSCQCSTRSTGKFEAKRLKEIALVLGKIKAINLVKDSFQEMITQKVASQSEEWKLVDTSRLDSFLRFWDLRGSDLFSEKAMLKEGTELLRNRITDLQTELGQICGCQLSFAQAAIIVAGLYDPDQNKIGAVSTQHVSGDFYLSLDVANLDPLKAACSKSRDIELLSEAETKDGLMVVVGSCRFEYVPVDERKWRFAVKVSEAKLPLVIKRQAREKDASKLLIFL